MSAQAALDQVADRWEAITDQYGREKQLAIYRTSMGISH
jgi:multiple sugar transport system substrate-binding protein